MMQTNDDFMDTPTDTQTATRPHTKLDLGSVDDALMAGVPAAQFKKIGDAVKGSIVSCEMAQQRDMATGKPLFWDDGNPRTQVLIILATDQRSADIDDDNGHRKLYVKKPSAMLAAIAKALDKTKLSQSIGGTLAIKYSGDGEPLQRGFNAPKLYVARFWPANVDNAIEPPTIAPTTAAPSRTEAMRHAWQAFGAGRPNHEEPTKRSEAWIKLVKAWWPGVPKENITAAQWEKLAKAEFALPPAPPEPDLSITEFDDSSIPF